MDNRRLDSVGWKSILLNTFSFAEGDGPNIYYKYVNEESQQLIIDLYEARTDLGYQINDSIYNSIRNRRDKLIIDKLDTMLNIEFVKDTLSFTENLLYYSEPIFFNDTVVCIYMANRIMPQKKFKHKVFFFGKKNESYNIIEFLNLEKRMFYKEIKLN